MIYDTSTYIMYIYVQDDIYHIDSTKNPNCKICIFDNIDIKVYSIKSAHTIINVYQDLRM